MPRSEILETFAEICAERRDAAAVRSLAGDRAAERTFGALAEEAAAFSRALAPMQSGLENAALPSRACVAARTGNRPEFLALFLACLKHGMVFLPLDGDATDGEVAAAARACRAAAVVASGSFHAAGEPLPMPGGFRLWRRFPAASVEGKACVLKFTSGSSGAPKAVLVSEENLIADGRNIVEAMGIVPSDVNAGAISMAHSYGLGSLVMPLLLQGTPVALDEGFRPKVFFRNAARTGASVFPGVPFMFEHLASHAPADKMPSSLRLCVSAGAPLPFGALARFKERFGMKIHSFYGSSETGGISYDDSEDIFEPVHVGKPLPRASVSIVKSRGTERVFVKGPAVAASYLPPASRGGFRDGGYLTDDVGRFDEAGNLHVEGRVSLFINVAGRKVNPFEVERVLMEIPGVAQAKVVGVPCERRGEKILACIVPGGGAPPDRLAVRRHCGARLSAHKIPREIAFLDALPLDSRGKVDMRLLARFTRDGRP